MSNTQAEVSSTGRRPLRLWPGVLVASILVLMRFVVPLFVPDAELYGLIAGVVGTPAIVLWWLLFSRAAWFERIAAIVLMIGATFATMLFVHPSIAGGMMGKMLFAYAIPGTLGPVFVAWAVATRRLAGGVRVATMAAAILLGCGIWTLARTEGVKGESLADLEWRWTPTAEERLLARVNDEPATPAPPGARTSSAPSGSAPAKESTPGTPDTTPALPSPAAPDKRPTETPAAPSATPAVPTATADTGATADPVATRAEWPGFRGPQRDGLVRGVRVDTDWTTHPPQELWRRPVGPGWSSFAVQGDLVYTQEQRGEEEVVSCYRLSTGEPVWRHRDRVRFYESNGGAGPRGTPTVHRGRTYTQGATGIVNALNALTGAVLWTRNASDDTGAALPGWGFTSSPLVVDDLVIVAASGRLVGYEAATGKPRWTRRTLGGGYSSPHLATFDGVRQVLLLSGGGATSVSPSDGAVLWQHSWVEGTNIVQPAAVSDEDVLIAAGDMMGGTGMRRISVTRPSEWSAQERWTSRGLKPYFNDFVVHKGHAFGFDGTILSCIEIESGERRWKGGRYGAGQMLLLPAQDLLLVLSEDGELALVSATPDKHTELARFKAIDGKTWNHPVLVGDVVLVRNGEEMAAFRLRRAETTRER